MYRNFADSKYRRQSGAWDVVFHVKFDITC